MILINPIFWANNRKSDSAFAPVLFDMKGTPVDKVPLH